MYIHTTDSKIQILYFKNIFKQNRQHKIITNILIKILYIYSRRQGRDQITDKIKCVWLCHQTESDRVRVFDRTHGHQNTPVTRAFTGQWYTKGYVTS